MALTEARHLHAIRIKAIVLTKRVERDLAHPRSGEREKRTPQIELTVITIRCHRIPEVSAKIRNEQCRIVVSDLKLASIDPFVPSELDVPAEAEEVGLRQHDAVGRRSSSASDLRLRRDRPGVLRDDQNVDDAVV